MHLDAIQGFHPDRWLHKKNNNAKPNSDWYVPYGFGPRYCLGKNLAKLEMKIFLATVIRKLDFPKLDMLPDNYDYSLKKKDPSDPNYFSVQWGKGVSVIPMAADGVLATVKASSLSLSSKKHRTNNKKRNNDDSFLVYNVTTTTLPLGLSSNSTQMVETTRA